MDVADHAFEKAETVAVGRQFTARHLLHRMGGVKGERQVQTAAGQQRIHARRRRRKIVSFAPQQGVQRIKVIPQRRGDLRKGTVWRVF